VPESVHLDLAAQAEQLGVAISNARALREFRWLWSVVGKDALSTAIAELPGGRKAFPANIAKQLKLRFPDQVLQEPPTPEELERRFDALRAAINRPGRKTTS